MLVRINQTDITRHILAGGYDVNEKTDAIVWKDGSGHKHKDRIRDYIAGSFDVKFKSEKDYSDFIQLYRRNKTDVNKVPLTVHVNNRNETRTAMFYMDLETELDRSASEKSYKAFTVTIEEV